MKILMRPIGVHKTCKFSKLFMCKSNASKKYSFRMRIIESREKKCGVTFEHYFRKNHIEIYRI